MMKAQNKYDWSTVIFTLIMLLCLIGCIFGIGMSSSKGQSFKSFETTEFIPNYEIISKNDSIHKLDSIIEHRNKCLELILKTIEYRRLELIDALPNSHYKKKYGTKDK